MNSYGKWALGLTVIVAIVWLRSWWTTPPAVEFDNLRYVQLLRTAVSARNEAWLSKVDAAVDHRLSAGEMSAAEHAHFERLLALARTGDWKTADRECFRFEKAQLNRRRREPAPDRHAHDHSHEASTDDSGQPRQSAKGPAIVRSGTGTL